MVWSVETATHNFEGALLNFVHLAVELSPLGGLRRGRTLTTLGLESVPRGVRVSQAGRGRIHYLEILIR